ncbi:extensin family protein [Roseiarcus fermentans]|nr:extensin family protein [Roseiarcus fermentans]
MTRPSRLAPVLRLALAAMAAAADAGTLDAGARTRLVSDAQGAAVMVADAASPVVPHPAQVRRRRDSGPGPPTAPPARQPPPGTASEVGAPTSSAAMSASDAARCFADLAARKVGFEQTNAVKLGHCELSGAVRLLSVATPFGDVLVSGGPTMLCGFAGQFSGWVRDVAAPMTLAYTGRKLAAIEIVSAFACRARADKPGAVPSEHARGDAVDVAAFVLADHSRVRVGQDASEAPLADDLVHALRMTACGYFTTVLGPGSDPAHADHLHFDSALHGATPNYRICQ